MVGRTALVIALLAVSPDAAGQPNPRAIVETADISGLTASPDGKWLAYRIERASTVTNRIDVDWYVVAADGQSSPLALGRTGTAWWDDAGVVVGGDARWSPDSRSLVVRALVDGQVALWSAQIPSGGFEQVAAGAGDIDAFAFLRDGSLVTSEGPARDTIARAEDLERENGILVDGTVDLGQPLYRGAMILGRPATQRFSGDWFDRAPLLAGEARVVRVQAPGAAIGRPAREEEKALVAPRPHPALFSVADLPTDLRLAVERRGVCTTRSACGARPRLSWWAAGAEGRDTIALRNSDYRQSLFIWSPQTRNLGPLATSEGLLSGGRYHFLPCVSAGPGVFCVEATAAIPPRLVRIATDGSKAIVHSPNPDPDSDGLLAETIAWQVSGSRASGVLIRPKIPGRLPLFINYYGCQGYLRGGVGDEWPLRALAAHGIAALCINMLPSGATGPARYQQGLETVKAAIASLSERGLVDPERVGMGGLSFGSEVAIYTATHSKLLKAVSIASVQLEPTYYWMNARPGRETFTKTIRSSWGLGAPDETPGAWKRRSAALNVDRINAPVLMQLPEQEARLSVELQSRLASARMGELHIFPLAPHVKAEPRQKLAAYQRNLDWFRFWLKGEVDPDPGKSAQYQRWSELGRPADRASTARAHRSTSAISMRRK